MPDEFDDPTAYYLGGDPAYSDPRQRRLNAWANHGGHRLTMPFMTKVAENLWQGGVEHQLVLPEFVEYKLSLYRREDYNILHDLKESRTVKMYDNLEQGFEQIPELAEWVNERRLLGPVFVHCQAGVNRSSLVVAAALIGAGDVKTGQEAIDLIREKRDRACLCNPAFEKWVRESAADAVNAYNRPAATSDSPVQPVRLLAGRR